MRVIYVVRFNPVTIHDNACLAPSSAYFLSGSLFVFPAVGVSAPPPPSPPPLCVLLLIRTPDVIKPRSSVLCKKRNWDRISFIYLFFNESFQTAKASFFKLTALIIKYRVMP